MTTKPMTIKMVDTVGQYHRIKTEIDQAIAEVLETGAYINGPSVARFRDHLASYLGAKHVIPCANGTDALQIAFMALGLKPGDEVITTPFTFIATAEAAALLGLVPVFVDVDPGIFNLDAGKIEAAISSKTKCIVPVHLFGQPADMEAIMKIAKAKNLFVVEDNAQSIGSDYTFSDGSQMKTGLIGDIGTTSFYPSKNLGAYGDAGALFTNDSVLAEKLKSICNHGAAKKYYHDRIGVNSRLDSLQAAILNVKLAHLDEFNAARIQVANWYDKLLGEIEGIEIPRRVTYATHVFHQYALRIKEGVAKRDQIKSHLETCGIPTMIYYPVPLHLQKALEPYGFRKGDLPVSEKLCTEVLALPIHTEMDSAQCEYICAILIECLKN